MAASDHQIGKFQFVTMEGPSDVVKQTVESLVRPGAPGTAFWRTSARGQPFQIVTKVDQTNFDLCSVTFVEYCGLIGEPPQIFHWNNTDYTTLFDMKVVVTNVEMVRAKAIKTAVGKKISSAPTAWLEARWSLTPVKVS